jgi:hypothetical protein
MTVVGIAGIGWFSLSGRLAGFQYTNVPLFHPYPPPGHFVNPYTGDPRYILSSVEAARVRAELLRDGELQLDALARGDPKMLPQIATGNFLVKLIQSVAANDAKGIMEREQNQDHVRWHEGLGNSTTFWSGSVKLLSSYQTPLTGVGKRGQHAR